MQASTCNKPADFLKHGRSFFGVFHGNALYRSLEDQKVLGFDKHSDLLQPPGIVLR
jgi:hypothetical protein